MTFDPLVYTQVAHFGYLTWITCCCHWCRCVVRGLAGRELAQIVIWVSHMDHILLSLVLLRCQKACRPKTCANMLRSLVKALQNCLPIPLPTHKWLVCVSPMHHILLSLVLLCCKRACKHKISANTLRSMVKACHPIPLPTIVWYLTWITTCCLCCRCACFA